jgi:hypothetical protein
MRDSIRRSMDGERRSAPAEGLGRDGEIAGPAAGPLRSVQNLRQRGLARLGQPAGRPPVQAGQHPLTHQHRHRQHLLPAGRHHRQRHPRAHQCDPCVDVQIVTGQADHGRDQPRQPAPGGIGGVVVDIAGKRGQQRMRAGRVITPPLPRQVRRKLHEARAPARVPVLAPRQHRDQLRCISLVTRHGHLHTAGRPAMTSLRPSGTNHYPAPAESQTLAQPAGTSGRARYGAGRLNGTMTVMVSGNQWAPPGCCGAPHAVCRYLMGAPKPRSVSLAGKP